MPIPDFQTLMLPLLKFCADGSEKYRVDAIDAMANEFKVTDDERAELLDSGKQSRFDNRVGWARSHLKAAQLISPTKRGYFRITERGKELLAERPERIDIALLKRYSEFQDFRTKKSLDSTSQEEPETSSTADITPEESLEKSHREVRSALESELLQMVKDCSPAFFERLVVELLVAMGYGGTLHDAGKAIGKSGDGGIDGIIKEDRLGLG
ncbi:MAG: restriction endonuclease, partial [Planctomycetaceae bacterium]